MPGESMIESLYRKFGDEIQRGVSGGNVFVYAGLYNDLANEGTELEPGHAVRYISTGDGGDDCGDSLWITTRHVRIQSGTDVAALNPCVLSGDPDASPWSSAPIDASPIDIAGSGDPNQLEEGDNNDGPVPAPLGSTWHDFANGRLFTRDSDGWTLGGGALAPAAFDFNAEIEWAVVIQGEQAFDVTTGGSIAVGLVTPIAAGVWWLQAFLRMVLNGFTGDDGQPISIDVTRLFDVIGTTANEFRCAAGHPVGFGWGVVNGTPVLDLIAHRAISAGVVRLVDPTTGDEVTTGLVDGDVLELTINTLIWND